MTELTSKVCVVGDFAVGKTSVVERFVHNQFSDKYLSTVGVKIDTKEIEHPDLRVSHKLILWDVAGSDRFGHREFAYLRGASGYIYVADGTRPATLDAALTIQSQILDKFGPAPSVILINKRDLAGDWLVDNKRIDALSARDMPVFKTSAKTGDDVELALVQLAELIIASDLRVD